MPFLYAEHILLYTLNDKTTLNDFFFIKFPTTKKSEKQKCDFNDQMSNIYGLVYVN